jgi:uncharacterized paraquat-inducible protein A
MSRCPLCQSVRIVITLSSTRHAFCTRCGTRWIQEGAEQRAISRFTIATSTARSTRRS